MAHIMNPTLENYETQCNSRHFFFPRRAKVEVPEGFVKPLLMQMKGKGLFVVPTQAPLDKDGMPEKGWDAKLAYKDAEWESLLQYRRGRLKARINNYILEKDEYQKRGVTLPARPEYEEALKWAQEIEEVLNMHKPIRENLSFKDFNVGIDVDDDIDIAPKKKSRKKKEVSFKTPIEENGTTE